MNTIKKGLKKAAYEFGVPLSEVKEVIQDLIDECYNSTDNEIHKNWRQICPNGEKPTPEQLIAYVTDKNKNEQSNTYQTSNKSRNIISLLFGRFLYLIKAPKMRVKSLITCQLTSYWA
jgi:hypothetical protein